MSTLSGSVTDAFEITNRIAHSGYAPGLVVVFGWNGNDDALPLVGDPVLIETAGREPREARLAEIKCHGEGRSFYFPGLTRDDGPIGSVVRWERRHVGPRQEDELGRLVPVASTAKAG